MRERAVLVMGTLSMLHEWDLEYGMRGARWDCMYILIRTESSISFISSQCLVLLI
jgi:hypothetical protein